VQAIFIVKLLNLKLKNEEKIEREKIEKIIKICEKKLKGLLKIYWI